MSADLATVQTQDKRTDGCDSWISDVENGLHFLKSGCNEAKL